MSASTELRLQLDAPDVIIRPEVCHIHPLARVNVAELIQTGQQAAESALPDLNQAASWRGNIKRLIKR